MKNNILKLISLVIILAISAWAFYILQNPQKKSAVNFITDKKCGEYVQKEVDINNNIIKVLISDTDCKKTQGLSGVKSLKDSEGLLFVFDKAGNYGFWMKDMLFPIDILWIGDDFKIVGVEKSLSTSSYPNIFGEKYKAMYILELSSGYSVKNNIKVGDPLVFHNK